MSTQRQGRRGEARALAYLEGRGLRLLEHNYRCRGGEIDLVMRDGATTVFVEVRLRRNRRFGGAAASITPSKQHRLCTAARHYLMVRGMPDGPVRFDVVALEGDEPVDWIRNAFDAPVD
ncbi:YraN family protein [Thioalkalivibrio sulfidiphilus]|uniref:YraN family protein n=1 Tax=Thioalkalivibrio sulfidiphilus TaxID=1033854 RepID=UPI00037CC5AE|nr:YraN family protein [Thioalkalivibrio sulfidiphilus]